MNTRRKERVDPLAATLGTSYFTFNPALSPEKSQELRRFFAAVNGSEHRGNWYVQDYLADGNPDYQKNPDLLKPDVEVVIAGYQWPRLTVSIDGSRLVWLTGHLADQDSCQPIMDVMWGIVMPALRKVGAVATGKVSVYKSATELRVVRRRMRVEIVYNDETGRRDVVGVYKEASENVHCVMHLKMSADEHGDPDFDVEWEEILELPVGLAEASFLRDKPAKRQKTADCAPEANAPEAAAKEGDLEGAMPPHVPSPERAPVTETVDLAPEHAENVVLVPNVADPASYPAAAEKAEVALTTEPSIAVAAEWEVYKKDAPVVGQIDSIYCE